MKRAIKLAMVFMALDLAAAAVKELWRREQEWQKSWGSEAAQ